MFNDQQNVDSPVKHTVFQSNVNAQSGMVLQTKRRTKRLFTVKEDTIARFICVSSISILKKIL